MIFTVTLPALNTLVQVGTRRAEESAFLARASMECRSKLAEVTVGAEAMETTDWVNFPDMANWSWKVTAVDGDVEGLMQVQVTVKFDPGNNPVQATLSQWVIDPAKRGSTQDRAILKSMDDQNAQPATPSDPETGTTGSGTTGTTGATTPGAGTTGSTGAGATAPSGTTGGGTSGAGATGGRSTGGATGGATGGGTGGGTTGGTTGKGGTK